MRRNETTEGETLLPNRICPATGADHRFVGQGEYCISSYMCGDCGIDLDDCPECISTWSAEVLRAADEFLLEIEDSITGYGQDDGVRGGHSEALHAVFIVMNAREYLQTGEIDGGVYKRGYEQVFTGDGENYEPGRRPIRETESKPGARID